MATLQVRDIDDRLYNFLKTSAKLKNRSISQEVVTIIEEYSNSNKRHFGNATAEFLELTGAWIDEREAEDIIKDIKTGREKSKRFGDSNVIFD